jgi:hypothetical protein
MYGLQHAQEHFQSFDGVKVLRLEQKMQKMGKGGGGLISEESARRKSEYLNMKPRASAITLVLCKPLPNLLNFAGYITVLCKPLPNLLNSAG